VEKGAPDTGKALGAQVANGLTYLAGEIPRSPNFNPFVGKYRPNDVELQNFFSKVEVFNDWTSVLGHMQQGSLRPGHIDAMKVLYPEILSDIRQHALDWTMEADVRPLPYRTGLMLSILMERRMEPALMATGSLQSMFGEAQQNSKQPNKVQRHVAKMPQLQNLPAFETEVGRITDK
jgi:hypothetical protein